MTTSLSHRTDHLQDFEYPDEEVFTPLQQAVLDGDEAIVECEAQEKKNLVARVGDAAEPHFRGCTALHLAVSEGHHRVIEILVEAGANLFALDDFGNTPLHWADPETVETVITLGIRQVMYGLKQPTRKTRSTTRFPFPKWINAPNDDGMPPLEHLLDQAQKATLDELHREFLLLDRKSPDLEVRILGLEDRYPIFKATRILLENGAGADEDEPKVLQNAALCYLFQKYVPGFKVL